MMVRTYGRRSRGGIGRTMSGSSLDGDVDDDPFAFSEEDYEHVNEEQSPEDVYNYSFSSQDSTRWTFQSDPDPRSSVSGQASGPGPGPGSSQKEPSLQLLAPVSDTRRSKVKNGGRQREKVSDSVFSLPPLPPPQQQLPKGLATLTETQEFGEMMEHVDEVNFSLDGLRRGQPIRVKRASLLSLLNVCGTSQQRRLLRTHGLTRSITDAIMRISLDDSPSNLAAATLFYLLTSDDQDCHFLDSDLSIGFLIKLLKPLASNAVADKVPSITSKLLAFRKDSLSSEDLAKKLDSSATAILDKVKAILVSCKDLEAGDEETYGMTRPELCAKWIALLIMEKACFSTVALEEVAVRKAREIFKERLGELGALDAVFELAIDFRSTLEEWLEQVSTSNVKLNTKENLQCLVLLIKCLRIMENATFLSKENQNRLLDMRKYFADRKFSLSFSKLVMEFITILSDLSLLRRNPSMTPSLKMPIHISSDSGHSLEFPLTVEQKVDSSAISSVRSSQECSSSGRIFLEAGSKMKTSQTQGWLSNSFSCSVFSRSETLSKPSKDDNCISNVRINLSKASSCSTTSRSSHSDASRNDTDPKMKSDRGKRAFQDVSVFGVEDSQDPFTFDEEEFVPSKWDILHGRKSSGCRQKSKLARRNLEERCSSQLISRQGELKDSGSSQSSQTSCSTVFYEESNKLLFDCLLTAVKVLMNLTNDNDLGCYQIASNGGLESLSSLIATHFPSFGSTMTSLSEETMDSRSLSDSVIDIDSQSHSPSLSDQEIDFLVAILGLLVNMVEKDYANRSRLASASVSWRCSTGSKEERKRSIIPLLCSIFLANQGAGEAVGENEPWDDEVALLQGEKEAEKMIIEAYSALLLAFLSTESKRTREAIAGYLPTHKLSVLVPVLERFVAFHVSLDVISPETHKIVNEVIETCRIP